MENYKIEDKWNLWYHSLTNDKWTKETYKKIIDINNLLDYYFLRKNFERQHLQNGMFFIMRNNIFPTWEDPDNRLGGCVSFKVYSKDIINAWNNLLLNLITENLTIDINDYDEINGISISPKKEFNIIKIWLKNNNENYKNLLNEFKPIFLLNESLYKKHELEY